ncbi:modular serine protease-like [Chironomus tepperi]|uniref:modular serine protease-like n=1 Tax=Chironomus tepperi TaxID=113505 RepID=UPI00391F6CE6
MKVLILFSALLVLTSLNFTVSSVLKNCSPFEFKCTEDNSCIPDELVCDGKADCSGRTDETEELCQKLQCPRYSFRCAYGACIDPTNVCNERKDCLDGSDELSINCIEEEENEHVGCPLDQYRCRSGECIDTENVCNGEVDCSDGSDEEENICLKITCPQNAFRCRYGACVPKSFRCTGTSRCADGSDEDELLCGAHYDVYLIKGNSTGKIPPGSCRLPSRNDLRYLNSIFGEEYLPGGYVHDGEYIEIVCKGGTTMNVSMDFDSSNSCDRTKWTRKWSLFPECQTICSGADVIGRTIKTVCEVNDKFVPCNQQHVVGTIAHITCGAYYEMPDLNVTKHLSQKLTCLSTGSWDKIALRCSPKCGRVTQAATAYVIGGKKAKNVAEVPWVAAIYKRDYLICGGTIISERLVISAAHCFFKEQPSSLTESVILEDLSLFKVAVGKYNRDISAQETFKSQFFNISEVISVPGYDGYMGFFSADFIIVVLDDFIVFRQHIVPICIDKNTNLEEEMIVEQGLIGIVGGYGFTTAGGSPSDVLKIGKLPTVSYSQCKKDAPQNFKQFVTPDKFCAGSVSGGDAVCQGDSGAGLAFPQMKDDEEIYFLRGVVSNARQVEGNCDLSFYTMFTNVYHYMRFIKSAEKRFPSS